MQHPLDGARLKILRAQEHLDALQVDTPPLAASRRSVWYNSARTGFLPSSQSKAWIAGEETREAMRHTICASVCVLVVGVASATLRAQEPTRVTLQVAVEKSVLAMPARDAPPEASALQRRRAARREGEHKLGVGVRIGGFGAGIGASLRSWFQPPWGFQVGVSHYGNGDFFNVGYSSTQITPALLYEFAPIKVHAPLSLRPFAGCGLSIITSSFPYLNNPDTTNTGALILGGVEIFFAKVPKLGVTGELEFTPSTSPF